MPGFIRRFTTIPTRQVLTAIEGVNIIDLPPPGSIQGVGTGTAGLVGEFADMTLGVQVSPAGLITTKPRPSQITSSKDLTDKLGGFDETLGEFGGDCGNGFVELRNKSFAALVAVPINLCSSKGTRVWRKLPGNTSAVLPTPVVPMQAAGVLAGREFKTGTDKARLAGPVNFSGGNSYESGVDGVAAPAGLPATSQNFASATGNFLLTGVKKGDAIVIDVVPTNTTTVTDNPLLIGAVTANVGSTTGFPTAGTIKIDSELIDYTGKTATSFTGLTRGTHGTAAAAHVLGSAVSLINDADTYRVRAVVDATNLTIEKQDGTNFTIANWLAAVALPWRLHVAADADSGGNTILSDAAGYVVPTRPLTNGAGLSTADGTIPASTLLTPTIIPPALTGTTWDSLSGLQAITDPVTGLLFAFAVQAPNAPNSAALDVLYGLAIDSFLGDDEPVHSVTTLWSARKANAGVSGIASKLKQHALDASARGRGRVVCISPNLDMLTESIAIGNAVPGVGANRDESVFYEWPGIITSVPEAVPFALKLADGFTTSDSDPNHLSGILDTGSDGWMASILSNLAAEKNPGQSSPPIPQVMAAALGIQHGVTGLGLPDYTLFRQFGVCAPKFDPAAGVLGFQSGITSSLIAGQKNINRRRLANEIEDSLALAVLQFAKQLLTENLKDAIVSETVAYLTDLQQPNNQAASRISGYLVDRNSGNTADQLDAGIYVVIVKVRSYATADFITFQVSVGESVNVTTLAA